LNKFQTNYKYNGERHQNQPKQLYRTFRYGKQTCEEEYLHYQMILSRIQYFLSIAIKLTPCCKYDIVTLAGDERDSNQHQQLLY